MLIRAPQAIINNPGDKNRFRVFLAGSIEMGIAPHWQKRIEDEFSNRDDVLLYNPRREDWDSSWIQTIENPQFREQVSWELAAMEAADLIIMYFAPDTQAPVTLLELGLHARFGKLVVCCPEGFWRKGNVDIVCQRYSISRADSLEQLIEFIYQKI
jgi:hypothetical protein